MISETKIGPQLGSDGAQINQRANRQGATVTQDVGGKYQEAVLRGGVWTISTASAGYTVVATTDISPLPANTGVPILGLFNPVGSQYNLIILQFFYSTVSGTPGGPLFWNVIPPNAGITLGGSNSGVNCLTYQVGGHQAKTFVNTVITGSAAAALLRPVGGPGAVAAGAGVYSIFEDTAGSIVVPPGGFIGTAALAVGTNHLLHNAIVWEEQHI